MRDLDVLHLDDALLVVNKPAGMLVQEDATGDPDVLRLGKAYLKERFRKPGNVFLGLVHRLDRPASGVVVLARTSNAAAHLSDQIRRRTPEKDYLAVVEGHCTGAGLRRDLLVETERGSRIAGGIDGDSGVMGRASGHDADRGREAVMQWRAVASRDDTSLVRIRLQTGRKHQIRVQLAGMGHPILGDMRYGATRELDGRNLALHCFRMAIIHPSDEKWMSFTASPRWKDLFAAEVSALVAAAS